MKSAFKRRLQNIRVVISDQTYDGICTALAAARSGIKTALIHNRSVLGGNASSEIRIHVSGASDSQKKPELEESGIIRCLRIVQATAR